MKKLSNIISNNTIIEFIQNHIIYILDSHRKTNYYQQELEKFDNFSKTQIIDNLANNDEDAFFFQQQFDYLERNDSYWNKEDFADLPNINFISKNEIVHKKLTHFRFSSPIISRDKKTLILKVIYQNSYTKELKGSDYIELFKANDKWEHLGHLFGTSI